MLQERTWHSVTDRSKAADAAAATNNSGREPVAARRRMPLICRAQQLLVKFNIKNSNDLHANQHSRILQ